MICKGLDNRIFEHIGNIKRNYVSKDKGTNTIPTH
jgi:hypothetical protein